MAIDIAATIASRNELEREFVSAAFSGVCSRTVAAADVLSACPLEMLSPGGIPHAIYRAMSELDGLGMPINPPSVWTHIHAALLADDPRTEPWPKHITAADLGDYAMSLYGRSEEAILFYARKMRDEGLKRRAEVELTSLLAEAQRYGNDPAEIAAGLAALAEKLDGGAPEACDLSGLMARVVSSVESGNAAKPMPTPWPNLNAVLKGGLVPGELAILAARPGMGKTALAGCLAVETARAGIPVLFISREVKDTTLASRMLAREGRIDARFFRQGIGQAANILPAVRGAAARLSELPLRIVEKSTAPMTPREVRRLAKTTRCLGLIIVDYLQLLNPDTRQNSREREVAEMSRSMKQLALDCDCPVLLLSQLNRQSEEAGREPRLSDLRESGAIEQDADIVIFLHARKENSSLARMPVKAIVAKGRSSGTGTANLLFNKPFADFEEDVHTDAWAKNCGGRPAAGNDL